MVARRKVERVLAVGREVDVVAARPQVDAERAQDLRLVVDHQDAGHDGETSRPMSMVTPPPGVSSTMIVPPIASTNPRATARPSPTPVSFELSPRRWNGWNTCSRCAGAYPRAAVDDAEVDAAVGDARFDAHACVGR